MKKLFGLILMTAWLFTPLAGPALAQDAPAGGEPAVVTDRETTVITEGDTTVITTVETTIINERSRGRRRRRRRPARRGPVL